MDCLTIWQPWASLIVAGAKPFEFRGWPAPRAYQGRRVGLHAGARKPVVAEMRALRIRLHSAECWTTGLRRDLAIELLERWSVAPGLLPLSSIVGTATLGPPRRASEIMAELGAPANDSDRDEHSNWAWPMLDPAPLEPIVPCKGAQGFWRGPSLAAEPRPAPASASPSCSAGFGLLILPTSFRRRFLAYACARPRP